MSVRDSVVLCGLLGLLGSVIGCESAPPFRLISSAPCGADGRSVELWCDDVSVCEYRVTGTGGVYRCSAGDTTGCTAAGEGALNECLNGLPDAPVPVDAPLPDVYRPCTPSTELDLLFVIDNSGSMAREQNLLLAEIPRVLSALAPLVSLHVGVITTDVGAGSVPFGESVPSCDPGYGDDGILRSTSTSLGPGCARTYPSRIFELPQGAPSGGFVTDVGCVLDLGTGGCGFEQQLDAMLIALSPAAPADFVASGYVPPTFAEGRTGHGDGANVGFLRTGSVLAIVMLSDEEDCSVPSYDIFYPNDPDYLGNPLNLRCSRFDGALYPVSRYVDGLLQLRPAPTRLVYLPIVGIPSDLVGSSYETLLADPRMQEVEDTAMDPSQRLVPSCDTANGVAYPPRRIVEVARGLRDAGASTAVLSICDSSGASWGDTVLREVSVALSCGAP